MEFNRGSFSHQNKSPEAPHHTPVSNLAALPEIFLKPVKRYSTFGLMQDRSDRYYKGLGCPRIMKGWKAEIKAETRYQRDSKKEICLWKTNNSLSY
jgi:hypothetical protein